MITKVLKVKIGVFWQTRDGGASSLSPLPNLLDRHRSPGSSDYLVFVVVISEFSWSVDGVPPGNRQRH